MTQVDGKTVFDEAALLYDKARWERHAQVHIAALSDEEEVVNDITVRAALPEDQAGADEAWASATETLRKTYRPSAQFLAEVWTPPSDLTRIVALIDGRVAGTTIYYTEDDRLHLMRFGTHADLRGRGVGRAMVEFLEGIARSRGFRCLSVYTVKECGVVPVYEKLGFRVISETPAEWAESDVFDTLTDVYLEKVLQ